MFINLNLFSAFSRQKLTSHRQQMIFFLFSNFHFIKFSFFKAVQKPKKKNFPSLLKLTFRLGKPGVDAHVRHDGESACAVILIRFVVNEGALITTTADDTIHLWSYSKQKCPQIVQSLKFQRER